MRSPTWLRSLAIAVALVAAATLGARADSVDDLIRELATTDSYKIKVQVCLSLGKKGDTRAVPILSGALRDDNPTVRLVAAQALGKIGDSSALSALQTAAADPVASVASMAKQAIAAIGKGRPGGPISKGGARFYINVGPLANKSHGGGPEAVRMFRDYLVRELKKTPSVTVDGGLQRGQTGYYVDGNIVRLTTQPAGSFSEVSCDLKVLVATWPAKSIIMWTDGGATVQVGTSPSQQATGMRDCLEAAVQGVRENIASFLKAQQ
jgi:hypothetical protein